MAYQFIRQEPCYDHILFVLALDRDKMKERILIGTEQQIRFRLDGNKDNDVIYDITRPLGRLNMIKKRTGIYMDLLPYVMHCTLTVGNSLHWNRLLVIFWQKNISPVIR